MLRVPYTVGFALLIAGCALLFFGYKEMRLANSADMQPQTMTAAELIANGPGDNGHIVLTDFWLLDAESVVEYPEDDQLKYNRIWAPVITNVDPYINLYHLSDPEGPLPLYTGNVGLILYSEDIASGEEFFRLLQTNSVQGLVVSPVEQIDGRELALLQESLTINPDTVLLLEHNRKPAGMGKVALMLGGGGVLFLAGPGLIFFGRRRATP